MNAVWNHRMFVRRHFTKIIRRVRDCNVYVWWPCVRCVVLLCAWCLFGRSLCREGFRLFKQANKLFFADNHLFAGIGWEGYETQRAIIGEPLVFIVQWVIRRGLNISTKPCGVWNHHMTDEGFYDEPPCINLVRTYMRSRYRDWPACMQLPRLTYMHAATVTDLHACSYLDWAARMHFILLLLVDL